MRRLSLWLTCALVFTAGAQTDSAPKVSPFPPAPFSFAGQWDCAGAFEGGTVHQSRFHGEAILKGTWLQLEETDLKPASGYVARYLIGYDASAKQLVEFDASNYAASVYRAEGGWANGTLTLTSDVDTSPNAAFAQKRFVFHIDSADAFTMDWHTRKTAASEWKAADHLPCKRAA